MRRRPLKDRFEEKFERRGPDECWLWTAATNGSGYGIIAPPGGLGAKAIDPKAMPLPAHRVSYELYVGPIPAGEHIDHLCSTPACVNPAHLQPVTPVQNSLRGRRRKWSDAQVQECRDLSAAGLTLHQIEGRTGIPHQTVYTFVSGSRRSVELDPYQTLDASGRRI